MKQMIFMGRALGLVWAGFWLFFAVASALGDGGNVWTGLAHALPLGGLAMAAAVAACRWPMQGGLALIAEGALLLGLMAYGYLRPGNPNAALFIALTLAAPPIVAGCLVVWGLIGDRSTA